MSSAFRVGDTKEQPLNLRQNLTINPAGAREWCESVEERYCAGQQMPKSCLFDEVAQARMPVDAAEDEYAVKLPVTALVLTITCINAH
jgi:hypothetical protein